ncbi:VC0807 family protein [Luteolibacter soli]|uniref:VC0807 family protein n=1 Tax=Luteolibacter soli TaxID=3135280 RepID=A0ABU9AUH6_9BACT
MPDPKAKTPQEHPLANILINVLIPVLVLSYLSKDPELQRKLGKAVRPWHIGPMWAMIVALIPPLAYGIWHFVKTRKGNVFSALGFISVLLTGGLTLYLWNADGTVKPNAGLLFGIKEASIPLVLAFAILASHKSESPLIRVFLYNDTIFDVPKIEDRVAQLGAESGYQRLLLQATRFFACSFVLSAAMNLGLAQWFFRDFNATAGDALSTYNTIIGKLTGWSFAVIGLPVMGILFVILIRLMKGLRELTGMKDEELMMPR